MPAKPKGVLRRYSRQKSAYWVATDPTARPAFSIERAARGAAVVHRPCEQMGQEGTPNQNCGNDQEAEDGLAHDFSHQRECSAMDSRLLVITEEMGGATPRAKNSRHSAP